MIDSLDHSNMPDPLDADVCKGSIDHHTQLSFRRGGDTLEALRLDWRARVPTYEPNDHWRDHGYKHAVTTFKSYSGSTRVGNWTTRVGEWHADATGCNLGPIRTITPAETIRGTRITVDQTIQYRIVIYAAGIGDDGLELAIETAMLSGEAKHEIE